MTKHVMFLAALGAFAAGCESSGRQGPAPTASAVPAPAPGAAAPTVCSRPAAAAGFAAQPVAVRDGDAVRIGFEASAPTDCAVWVVDEKGAVVRHLAAGVLGPDAPPPFKAGALAQTLVWDGLDDRGRPAPAGRLSVKVGLGTRAEFDRIIGHDAQWLGNVHGLACGPKGEVYAYTSRGICMLDREGKYVRQIAPAPADTPVEKLPGLKPVKLADGSTYFQRGYAFPGSEVGSMAITKQGQLLLPGPSRYARNLTRIGVDGSVPPDAFDTRLTALSDVGYLFLAASPDGKQVYMAGAEAGYKGDDARKVCYRQVVYRLRLDSPGPAEIFTGDDENSGGPGFSVNDPKGLATDAQGRLYVCNHGGDNVAVYTPDGGMVRSMKVKRPRLVAVHPRTGQVYVLAGDDQGYQKYGYDYPATMTEARLVRLSADGQVELETKLEDAWVRTAKTRPGPCYLLTMAADFSGDRPLIWVGVSYPGAQYSKWNLVRIEDQGEAFGAPREVCPKPKGTLDEAPLQLVLDRQRDILYYNAGTSHLGRFSGDGQPLEKIRFRDPKADTKLYVGEAAVGPDGNLYALLYAQYKYAECHVMRFDPEGQPLPLAKAEAGAAVKHPFKGGGGNSARGMSVAPDGGIYVMHYDDGYAKTADLVPWDKSFGLRVAVTRFSPEGELLDERLIGHLRSGGNGIRVDRAGCVYVGDNVMPWGVTFPRDFVGALADPLSRPYPARLDGGGFDPLLRNMGSLFKFGPKGGLMAGLLPDAPGKKPARPAGDLWKPAPEQQWLLHNCNRLKLTGAEWQFHGMSPVPAQYQGVTHVERCVCRGARFDLDEFGRAFVPDALRRRVTVLDSAGNVVTRFGRPGNRDYTGQGVELADPWWVAAASDRVYVGEAGAPRIVKVRLECAASAACDVPGK